MEFDAVIRHRANERLEAMRQAHHTNISRLRTQVFLAHPEIARLDARIRATTPAMMRTATIGGPGSKEKLQELRKLNLDLQRQSAELLSQLGLEPDALDDRPLCPKCRDSGWNGPNQMCECLHRLCTEEQTRELEQMLNMKGRTFDDFRLDVYSSQFDPSFGSSPRENMSIIRNVCRQYAMHCEKPDYSTHNLLLTGSPGLGKTFLSGCIAMEASARGLDVAYETAAALFANYEAKRFQSGTEAGKAADARVYRYEHCNLMILDDLGSEMKNPVATAALYQLVNCRIVADLCTIISTNILPAQLAARYSDKTASRLNGTDYMTLRFFGTDLRQVLHPQR